MKRTAPEKYHELLTPDYPLGCKRRVLDGGWLASMQDPGFELTAQPLAALKEHAVVLGPRKQLPDPEKPSSAPTATREIKADVIVLANGFEVGEWLHPMHVVGVDGKALHEVWRERGGAQAYLGTAMDGFPNMFFIFGPNTVTGHTSVILGSECSVEHALKFVKPLLDGTASRVEVKREAELAYTADIQEKLKNTVFQSCNNWYQTANGWNSVTYP